MSNDGGICDSSSNVDNSLVGVQDRVIRPLIVEPEGAPRDYTVSEFICQQMPGLWVKLVNVKLLLSMAILARGRRVARPPFHINKK